MQILFLGNCQINALRGIGRDMFPRLPTEFQSITPHWGAFDAAKVRKSLAEADLVVAQAVTNPHTVFNVSDIRASTHADIIFVPYVYLDGIAGLEKVSSKGKAVIKGADEVLAGNPNRRPMDIFKDLCRGKIDMRNEARLMDSFARLRGDEADHCHLRISDYLAETLNDRPAAFAINHPTQHVLFEMFRRLCGVLDLRYDNCVERDQILWAKRALPSADRALMPMDIAALGLNYPADPHWFSAAHKLIDLAIKKRQIAGNVPVQVPLAS